ncbi:unnamed protein product [Haemonchus placei]|uniref:Sulfatase domain-containing protein n=1 Tax=Haemonchus placei TaxID=6290 RepID=A0A0N4W7B6_HAEPC|nr:unnamed protein product [Haemonchus placei]
MDNITSIFDTCPLYLYNPLDITLLGFYYPTYNRKKNCKVYKPITQLVDGYVLLSNNASNHTCHARCIFPKKDRGYLGTLWVKVPSVDRLECDIVETECIKEDILESFLHTQIFEQKSLPKTLEYLQETMGGVQMEFLNKVGDNSRPNGFPLAFGTPKVAQVWPTTLAHETLKDLYHADVQFLEFFQRNRAIIERSFFFFMGDHGPRRDGIGNIRLGQYENLNPFLMVIIPAAYRSTPMHLQLKQKVLQLMTNFDIHATLMDILKLEPPSEFRNTSYRSMEPLSKGSSLFREWRGPRNCRTLPIPSQYCICQYDWTNVDNQTVQLELGEFFAEQLNLQLTNGGVMEKCQRQFYNRISSMRQLYDRDELLYDVVVYLSPSNGLFSVGDF